MSMPKKTAGFGYIEKNLNDSDVGLTTVVPQDSSTDPAAGFTYITIDDVRPKSFCRFGSWTKATFKDYLKNDLVADYTGTIQKDLNDSDVGLTTVSHESSVEIRSS